MADFGIGESPFGNITGTITVAEGSITGKFELGNSLGFITSAIELFSFL